MIREFDRLLDRLLARPPARQSDRARERDDLVAAILAANWNRAPSAAEIAAHGADLPPEASPAEWATRLLARLLPPEARLFVPPGHYYSPIAPRHEVEAHVRRMEEAGVPERLPDIAIDRATLLAFWDGLLPFLRDIPFGPEARPPLRYRFDNPAYAHGDGSVLHAMLRRFRPKRLIEIGSGWSTLCTLDTVEHALGGACDVTLIEPYPELVRSLIGDGRAPDRIIERGLQDVPLSTFDALEAGDVLFIDSTHVARTGSDVCREMFEILPRLKAGVLVHVHDVFWPFEYPRLWAVDENRSWSELYVLRALLTGNPGWTVLAFNDYLAKVAGAEVAAEYPAFMANPGGALWLRKEAHPSPEGRTGPD